MFFLVLLAITRLRSLRCLPINNQTKQSGDAHRVTLLAVPVSQPHSVQPVHLEIYYMNTTAPATQLVSLGFLKKLEEKFAESVIKVVLYVPLVFICTLNLVFNNVPLVSLLMLAVYVKAKQCQS